MNWSLAFQIFVSSGTISFLGFVVKAFMDRRKVSADTDSVQVSTALAQMTSAVAQASQATADVAVLRDEMRRLRATVRAHEVWDRMVIRELEKKDITVEAPPELWLI